MIKTCFFRNAKSVPVENNDNHIFTSNSAPQPYLVICRLALSAFKVRSLMKCSFTMQRFDADPCDIVVDAQAISLTNRQGYFSHAA